MVGSTQRLMAQIRSALRHDLVPARGQGLAEYALILALIAIVAIIALLFLGGQIQQVLSSVGDSI